jgi:hypothetical protein
MLRSPHVYALQIASISALRDTPGSSRGGSVAKKFKLIRNKHILKSFRVKRVEKVLLFFCKIHSRRYYTLNFDELKIFCNITQQPTLLVQPSF